MATAVTVRPMQPADLEPLRWVIYRAYLEVLLQLYGPDSTTGYEVRSPEFMAMYLRREPAGCFAAAAPDGSVVGAVFCFVWGEVGWFGSLAVAPEWQGRGVGQALTRRAVDYLVEQRCRRIGLETWPQSPLVRHLYGKFGFRACRPTVKLSRRIVAHTGPTGGTAPNVRWTGRSRLEEAAEAIQAVRAVTCVQAAAGRGEPAVDYRIEVCVAVEAGWAELAVWRGGAGEAVGFALCYLQKPGGGPAAGLDVRLLGVAPGPQAEDVLDGLLTACDARARGLGLPSVTCDVNLRHSHAAASLRQRGFRPTYELLRMERPLDGFDPMSRSRLIDCARWAG
ncbi:MAG: GNAT family N-acetyltransferase [Chloroflexota bacterium]